MRISKAIKITNKAGDSIEFPSIANASKELETSKDTIRRRLADGLWLHTKFGVYKVGSICS